MTPSDLYQRIHALSRPHITDYVDDLEKHDKKWITQSNIEKQREFIHITKGYGTWLAIFHHRDDLPEDGVQVPYLFGHAGWMHIAKANVDCIKYYCNPSNKLWLHVQPKTGRITQITHTEAERLIRENHQDILRQGRARHRKAA